MSAVFLDLDGTLMKSHLGILASIRHGLREIDRPELAETDLMWMIGPPFADSFPQLGLSEAEVEAAIAAYRAHYTAGGMYEAELYPGTLEVLAALQDQGARLYLMTAKPHAYATKITAHFGIAPFMAREFGPELDGTFNWKGDLLAHAIKVTGEDPESSVMVGDRHHDIAAAAEVGMASLAARWGYGAEAEWGTARAVVERIADLPAAVAALHLG
ncbi:MAG: HAD hydrolase-like protein [Silicimonas sp.]|nr:HAD hydrolase-like protein [Silicimonas sp.]